MTTQERIDQLKLQQEQAKEVFIKCQGAIEVLQEVLKNETEPDKPKEKQ